MDYLSAVAAVALMITVLVFTVNIDKYHACPDE